MADNVTDLLSRHSTADLCSAHREVLAMNGSLSALVPGSRLHGRAKTVRTSPGENAAIHRAVREAGPNDVLVVGGGDATCGIFGDILATCCRIKGIPGLVIEGAIRDTAELRRMQFSVFSLGTSPLAPAKRDPGEIDVAITCAGVRVRPGDMVVADDDGIVIVPHEIVSEVGVRAEKMVQWEEQVRARVHNGEGTCSIFGID